MASAFFLYIDFITDGIKLLAGFLIEPIGSNLVEYLIHFSFFLQSEREIQQKQKTEMNVMIPPSCLLIRKDFFVTLN
ncbi:hypothetical protein MtrunA17_Chr4g0005571 [Medicago truncatula]|uniref:Uncharacterized protein n=1 Tax=Medicago truncatula TaxID=3880 RepID=A0A396I3F8_MEDTR|nr:hypothetical protein MtrunA17_Chr4g0005571 [Medicago truncatula]